MCLSVCLSARLFICLYLSVCMLISQSAYQFACLSVCLFTFSTLSDSSDLFDAVYFTSLSKSLFDSVCASLVEAKLDRKKQSLTWHWLSLSKNSHVAYDSFSVSLSSTLGPLLHVHKLHVSIILEPASQPGRITVAHV